MSADPLPERDAPCILGTWGGGAGAVEFGEEEFGRWGFCRSLPGGKPAGDSASQHPGYPPETPGFCGGSFRTPTLGLGVPHIPHLLVPRPRRPWLLVPDLALGTSPPFPEGQAPRGAVAGAGSAGLRTAGRSRRGRTGRGAPTGLGFLSPSSETRRAEGGGRREMLIPSRLPLTLPSDSIHASNRSFIPFTFIPNFCLWPLSIRSAPTVCQRALGSFGEPQCRGDPSSSLAASPR